MHSAARWVETADASTTAAICRWRLLLEHPEVPEKPPKNEKNQYRAEAATAELLCTISGGDAAQEFAHRRSSRSQFAAANSRLRTDAELIWCLATSLTSAHVHRRGGRRWIIPAASADAVSSRADDIMPCMSEALKTLSGCEFIA
jgi:hypothetical protein